MKKVKKPFYRRWWFVFIVVIVVVGIIGSVKKGIENTSDKNVTYTWADGVLANLIPQPDSQYGKIRMENEEYFSIDVYKTSKEEYEEYVEKCKDRGFTVDYMRQDTYYSADDEEGYSLRLSYDEKEKTLSIALNAPDDNLPSQEQGEAFSVLQDGNSPSMGQEDEGIRPEFKETLDSYEAFMDEYCEFMKKYANADSDEILSMAKDYLRLMEKEIEWAEKIENMESEEMSDEEAEYYLKVSLRVSQKLLEQ